MPDYDLRGLSPRSFETLVQALAIDSLGPGLVVFGDGPDGGREATFEGQVPYPSTADQWDGYCVVQAKFLQRPRDTRQDGRWALAQLEHELQAFADPAKHRRCPDYYIYATNVVLTPARGTGVKDRFTALFAKYASSVPIRDWRIWDYDQLRSSLDRNEGVRRAYAAWITPGDVLASILDWIETSSPNFIDLITGFLAKELLVDQFANLEQAGHSTEDKIPLARVFVDLPFSDRSRSEPIDNAETRLLVGEVLKLAAERLDPLTQSLCRSTAPAASPILAREPGRLVLIGGPGQGKTTVGQLVCQLFRASLLRQRPDHLLSAEVHHALSSVVDLSVPLKLDLPTARRFPIRIVLNEFAAALKTAVSDNLSLLAYIAGLIARRSGRPVGPEDVRRWLKDYPWLLVLDGLDEVPPSSNRDDVLRRIQDFWVDATSCNADVLVLATTRPQGYNDDFSPTHYRHFWLVPLSVRQALNYAHRFVDVRYGSDPDRRAKISVRLKQASRHAATARLMRSPLQVTIMATLVDQIGQPPQDRWRLFHEYYQVIYRREMERDIPAAQLLREHRKDIDTIHGRVALRLQLESELAGGTDARLSTDRFARIVDERLAEEEYVGSHLHHLRDQIIEAAATRLVFLVGLETNQFGFEIRALQEFMASEALMQGPDQLVQERLRAIAPISHWRNVFLFAAGRCFAEAQHLRDTVHTICVELNHDLGGATGAITRLGSVLAIDLLEDGAARRQPKYEKLLASCALEVVALPPSAIHRRLADVFDPRFEGILREELNRGLSRSPAEALGAWATVAALSVRDLPWANDLASLAWPTDPETQLLVISVVSPHQAWPRWWMARADECFRRHDPSELTSIAALAGASSAEDLPWYNLARALSTRQLWPSLSVAIKDRDSGSVGLNLNITRLAPPKAVLPEEADSSEHPGWGIIRRALRFSAAPSAMLLADILSDCASSLSSSASRLAQRFPWVLAKCIQESENQDRLLALSRDARAGLLGDHATWSIAEQRWEQEGVTFPIISSQTRSLDLTAFPFDVATVYPSFADPLVLDHLIEWHSSAPASEAKRMIASWILPLLTIPVFLSHKPDKLTPEVMGELAGSAGAEGIVYLTGLLELSDTKNRRWIESLDAVGRSRVEIVSSFWPHDEAEVNSSLNDIIATLAREPHMDGLARLIVESMALESVPIDIDPIPVANLVLSEERYGGIKLFFDVCQRHLAEAQVDELARRAITILGARHDGLASMLRALAAYQGPSTSIEQFLRAFARRLSSDEWKIRAQIIFELERSARRRKSGLHDRTTWEALAFPADLLKD